MPNRDLTGQHVVVTGANRGMGAAFARRLAQEPLAGIYLAARSPEKCPLFDPPDGGAKVVKAIPLDLGSAETIERDVASWAEALPHVDVVVNNAGQLTSGLLDQQPVAGMLSMFQVNLVGAVHLTRLLLPGMLDRHRGLIVNNASISGYAWFPATSSYAATKAGLVGFSESLRRELAGTGVDVMHLVTPRIETEMAEAMDEQYAGLVDTSSFESHTADEWAEKVVHGMLAGKHIVGPGGRTAMAKLLSRGPAGLLDRISRSLYEQPADRRKP